MVLRQVTYPILPGKDLRGWLRKTAAPALKRVKGCRAVYLWYDKASNEGGATFVFENRNALRAYKASPTFKTLVADLQSLWIDTARPVSEKVYDVLA
jgi:quinol monooxygenase YgiN